MFEMADVARMAGLTPVEEIKSAKISTKPRVFLDMDGVLVNFTKALCKLLKIPYTQDRAYGYDFWKYCGMTDDEFRDTITREARWWATMEPHPYAKDLVHWLIDQGIDWHILSSSMYDCDCFAGKSQWVRKHLGDEGMKRFILVCGDKGRIARKGDILVDDGPHNWDAWEAAGGEAFPWIEYPPKHPELPAQLDRLKTFISFRA